MVLTTYSLCLTRPAPKSRCDSSCGGFPSHANKPSPDATASDFHRASPERMPTARDLHIPTVETRLPANRKSMYTALVYVAYYKIPTSLQRSSSLCVSYFDGMVALVIQRGEGVTRMEEPKTSDSAAMF
ncbi:hypothetical protein Bbelb_091810 [Branchiostoma belcheri]|nr:hypothetical protein Bbelb_091810 [Branchiostoma belcheri]